MSRTSRAAFDFRNAAAYDPGRKPSPRNHPRRKRTASLSTLLGIGTELGSSDQESDLVRALRRGSQDSINNTGQQLVRRQLNIQPTLTIRQGFPVRVIVNRDLVMAPYAQEASR